jgi:hypothetical protein
MVKIGCRFRFGVETLDVLWSSHATGQNHLQRHSPVKAQLPGFVDDAHTAPSDFLQ